MEDAVYDISEPITSVYTANFERLLFGNKVRWTSKGKDEIV